MDSEPVGQINVVDFKNSGLRSREQCRRRGKAKEGQGDRKTGRQGDMGQKDRGTGQQRTVGQGDSCLLDEYILEFVCTVLLDLNKHVGPACPHRTVC